MARKFKVWLDSGANNQSKYETETTLDELGVTEDQWDALSDAEKDNLMRDVAFEHGDWGYSEINEGEES